MGGQADRRTGFGIVSTPEAASVGTPELLPCPFCDGEAVVTTDEYAGLPPAIWVVVCHAPTLCGAEVGFFPSKEQAITAWNTRAALQSPAPMELEISGGLPIACGACGRSVYEHPSEGKFISCQHGLAPVDAERIEACAREIASRSHRYSVLCEPPVVREILRRYFGLRGAPADGEGNKG